MDMVLYNLGATFFLPRNRQLRRVSHACQKFNVSLRLRPSAKFICSIHETLIVIAQLARMIGTSANSVAKFCPLTGYKRIVHDVFVDDG
jgi:hypothetical protein